MKTTKPEIFSFFPMIKLALLGLAAMMALPEPVQAQQRYTGVEVQLSSGYVYQGGRKSKRGVKLTTSSVSLPDLNAILAPTPLPKQQPVPQKKAAPTPAAAAPVNNNAAPRFGFGSGPVQPPAPVDPRIPIDPGFGPLAPVVPPAVNNAPIPPVQPQVITQPTVQIQHTTTIPFAHGYYPRSYAPRVPYIYPSHSCGYPYYSGYSIYSSRAPLRGTFTSSRNYLSGFRSFGFSF